MKRNIVTISVEFNSNLSYRFMITPTFLSLFDRIPEIRNKSAKPHTIYKFNTNHTHKGYIERMYNNFSCVHSVSFS